MKYKDYLRSDHWKEKRKLIIFQRRGCEVCGRDKYLHVHHKTYKNIGNENDDDLVVLCSLHHKKVHFTNKGNFVNWENRNSYRIKSMKKNRKFNLMPPMMACNRCKKEPLMHFYHVWANGSKHFMVICEQCGVHKQKKIKDLNIPEVTTEELRSCRKNKNRLLNYIRSDQATKHGLSL